MEALSEDILGAVDFSSRVGGGNPDDFCNGSRVLTFEIEQNDLAIGGAELVDQSHQAFEHQSPVRVVCAGQQQSLVEADPVMSDRSPDV